jgi:hypothetical protein
VNDFQLTNPENPDKCDPKLSQWYTSPELAERIVEWALRPWLVNKQELRVLEPSAGRGALAVQLRDRVRNVTCVEIDRDNALQLFRHGLDVYEENFLDLEPDTPFDLAVMNPPFEGGQTERHVLHALKFAPRVVCHCPLTTLAGQDRCKGLWSQAYLKRLVIHASRPKYSGSLEGGKTDMCTIDVVRRPELHPLRVASGGVEIEWWL